MLTLLRILLRSLELAAVLLVADCVAAYASTSLGFAFIEILGDLMLVEVGVLFVVAGLIDFASSIAVAQFRKTVLRSKQGYSPSGHKESQHRASVSLVTGLILLLLLIIAAAMQQGI